MKHTVLLAICLVALAAQIAALAKEAMPKYDVTADCRHAAPPFTCGDFTPVGKYKMAQNNQGACISNCQTSFDICARLRVNSGIARNCESERDFCTQACQLLPTPLPLPLTR